MEIVFDNDISVVRHGCGDFENGKLSATSSSRIG